MRILLVHNQYKVRGGEDSVVSLDMQALRERGHEVFLYRRDNREIDGYSLSEKAKLLKNGYYSHRTVQDLGGIIRCFKPEIAHVHNIYPLVSPSVYEVLYGNRIPIVQTLHNYRFICPNGLFFNSEGICEKCLAKSSFYSCVRNRCYHNNRLESLWYASIISNAYKKYYPMISVFISMHDFMRDKMIKRGYGANRVITLPNGIPKPLMQRVRKKEDYFLYLGRISYGKGILKTVVHLGRKTNLNLKIAGYGEGREWLCGYLKSNEIGHVEYLGYKTGEEKDRLISKAIAVIVPSECFENLPTVILEAYALGTAAIVPEIGAFSYLVDNNKTGLYFKYGDYDDLTIKMEKLQSCRELIHTLSQNAYEKFCRRYTMDIHIKGLLELYSNTINRLKAVV